MVIYVLVGKSFFFLFLTCLDSDRDRDDLSVAMRGQIEPIKVLLCIGHLQLTLALSNGADIEPSNATYTFHFLFRDVVTILIVFRCGSFRREELTLDEYNVFTAGGVVEDPTESCRWVLSHHEPLFFTFGSVKCNALSFEISQASRLLISKVF